MLFAQMAVNQVIWKVVGCSKDTGIHHGIIARKKTKLFMSTHADIYHRERQRKKEIGPFTRISGLILDKKIVQEIEVPYYRYSLQGIHERLLFFLLLHTLLF